MEPGSRAKAIYDFQGTEPSELTLRAGDVVDIVERIDENWLVGTLDGKTGSFPSSYVTSVLQKKVIAKETFPASTDGDLAFQKGDIITLLDKIDDNWWRGQLGDNIGIFPFNYVEEYNASNNQESQTAGGDAQKARALQDLTGQLHDELSFKKNDVITITEKVDGDWYRGTLNGKNGLVPSFCVEMLASDTSQSSLGTDQSQKVDYSKLNDNLRQSLQVQIIREN
ncbi:SH3 domain-containing protein 19-like [Ptychodera flava]|uniref:SH3 domain-containing protein 19-like n=1 Tax=Ptychodera flava TaxID=63121 RepID=UPI00396A704F